MSLVRSIATVSGFTLLSRLLGFCRDILIAGMLGAGGMADAFFVAFKFPNLFRRLFGEGAFSAAFIPLLAGDIEKRGMDAAREFAARAMSMLILITGFLVAIIEILMPWAMYVFAPGFAENPEKFELAVELSRITFPYLAFISAVALMSGVMNTLHRYAAAAAAPIILNICLIAALLGLAPVTETPAHALAWGVAIAGVAQFLMLVIACKRVGFAIKWQMPRVDDRIKLLGKRMIPGMIGAGVYQINLLIDTMLASLVSDGAVSWLYYADRVQQLPLGVIGIAIGTALLPTLSRQLQGDDAKTAMYSQNRGIEIALLLTLPAAIALGVMGLPVINVLFERGAFGAEETLMTGMALTVFAFGLPASVLVKVLAPGFFAREDTKTPIRIGISCMVLNIVLIVVLMPWFGHLGIAAATSVSVWVNATSLGLILHRRGDLTFDARLARRIPRILVASALMGSALWFAIDAFWQNDALSITRIITMAVIVTGGMAVYAITAQLLGATSFSELKATLKRGKPA
ncbi:MAG: murein biosynthesis integral membrane protein MurJ [Thalassospira sp.]|uniref:murein biosynthesis integral membrane protein MurJ n=1 Tax=unclassified Thalassospira TaxID=2648997 RepID=UPI000C5C4F0D|nr:MULTISPECIES: murein biosynthesis integral membrane protein MurJ [unclassified Thalassospira]MBE71392.1 murein biosynthesis integral membrane protein MurJ [Thalassospira sp.]QPO11760.1 murein biosynthesis integral membrane protein MurJ [Thalassospira sp. A40-3]|tara:strand:- start:2370 stop:3920 length:1551 start_codon:yes stop_codon:yes gene_type:complete